MKMTMAEGRDLIERITDFVKNDCGTLNSVITVK